MNNYTYGKGKKTRNLKIKMYNESLSKGEKKNIYIYIYIYEKKKEKANLVIPIEKKINRYAIDWSKEKTTIIAAKLQVQKVLNTK